MTTQEANEYWQQQAQRSGNTCLPEPGCLIDSDWWVGWE